MAWSSFLESFSEISCINDVLLNFVRPRVSCRDHSGVLDGTTIVPWGNFSPLCLNFFLAWDYIFDLGLFCPLLTIDSASFSKNLGRNFWSKWKIKQKDKFSHYWFLIGHRDYDQKALILLYWLSSKQLLNPLSRIFFHKIAWKSQIIKWTANWAENYSVYKILMRRNLL